MSWASCAILRGRGAQDLSADHQPSRRVHREAVYLGFALFRCPGCRACWQPSEPRGDPLRYPYLEASDVAEALRYAASLAEDETIDLTG
jgi:hypothetical protein